MPKPVSFAGTAVTSDGLKMYVLGGATADDGLGSDQVQVYEVGKGWSTLTSVSLPSPTSQMCAVTHKDRWVVGVSGDVAGCLDLEYQTWTEFRDWEPSEGGPRPVPKVSGAGCTTYGIDGVTYMLVAGGTEAQSGSSTKAFLIWLDALAYGVSFPLPDL